MLWHLSDRLAAKAAKYLNPGEQFQTAFYAMTGTYDYNDCAVIVTDQRIMLFELSFTGQLARHISDIARATKIGPFKGFLQHWTTALGPNLGIHRRFAKQVFLADALIK